jgi:biopolymer transport protein ExbD
VGRHRFKQDEHNPSEGEINLVPYLDIMVNLIMFMLLTFQVLAELKMITFNPPASGGDDTVTTGDKDEEKKLMLTVMITKSGFQILTTDENAGKEVIPAKNDGDHDYADLTKRLERIRKDVTNIDENLIVVAEPDIIYDVVVKTLDATRTTADGKKDLFPKVTLGMAVGTQ